MTADYFGENHDAAQIGVGARSRTGSGCSFR
jgi:hypothetical protein